MPIKKSAKKALRQSKKRRFGNLNKKEKMKNVLKEIRNLVAEKKIKEAKELLPQAYKILDKAVKIKLVKKNTAARQKSRITKLVQKVSKN